MNILKMTSFQVNTTLLLMISIYCFIMQIGEAKSDNSSLTVDRLLFADSFFQKVAVGKEENVIFSPFSIQTALTLLFFGAGGKTAQELRNVLNLGNIESEDIANNYEKFLGRLSYSSNDDNAVQLRSANRIYVDENAKLKHNFIEIAKRAFQSGAEQVNFGDSANAVEKINTFVEEQTQHKIKDLLQNDSVDGLTKLVLVNAIYFKGKWEQPFSAGDTLKADFLYGSNKVQVDTMHMTADVQYGEFPELEAKVLELRYKNSNISMLFILPNAVDGLNDLEQKLEVKNVNEIVSKLELREVTISLPKFRIEYNLDLVEPLQELGLKTAFDPVLADLSGLLEDSEGVFVTEAKHKAYIDVNEAGSEAAAATFVAAGFFSMPPPPATFNANHPFVFAIRDSEAVYFSGHLVKF